MAKKWKPKPWSHEIRTYIDKLSDEELCEHIRHYLHQQWTVLYEQKHHPAWKGICEEAVTTIFAAVRIEEEKRSRRRGTALEFVYDAIDRYTIHRDLYDGEQSFFPFAVVNEYVKQGYGFTTALQVFQRTLDIAVREKRINENDIAMRLSSICFALLRAVEVRKKGTLFRTNDDACLMAIELITVSMNVIAVFTRETIIMHEQTPEMIVELVDIAIALGYRRKEFQDLVGKEQEKLLAVLRLIQNFPALQTREIFEYILRNNHEVTQVYSEPNRFVETLAVRTAFFPTLPLPTLTATVALVNNLEHATALFTLTHDSVAITAIVDMCTRWETPLPRCIASISAATHRVPLTLVLKALAYIPPNELIATIEKVGAEHADAFVGALTHMRRRDAEAILVAFIPETVEQYCCLDILHRTYAHRQLASLVPYARAAKWNTKRASLFIDADRYGVSLSWLEHNANTYGLTTLTIRYHLECILGRKPTMHEVENVRMHCTKPLKAHTVKRIVQRHGVIAQRPITETVATLIKKIPAKETLTQATPVIQLLCNDLVPSDIDAEHVSITIVWGFIMPTQQRAFIGGHPIPERHVRSNAARKLKRSFSLDMFDRALHWLKSVGVARELSKGGSNGQALSMNLRSDDSVGQALIDRGLALRRSFQR